MSVPMKPLLESKPYSSRDNALKEVQRYLFVKLSSRRHSSTGISDRRLAFAAQCTGSEWFAKHVMSGKLSDDEAFEIAFETWFKRTTFRIFAQRDSHADRWRLELEELACHDARARRAWEQIRSWWPAPAVEPSRSSEIEVARAWAQERQFRPMVDDVGATVLALWSIGGGLEAPCTGPRAEQLFESRVDKWKKYLKRVRRGAGPRPRLRGDTGL